MATHSSILAWKIPQTKGVWQATVHWVAELDMTEHACMQINILVYVYFVLCIHIETHIFMLIVYKVELCQVLEIKQWIKHSSKFEEFKFSLLDITIVWNIGMIDKWHARTPKYSPGTKSYIHSCLLPKPDIFCQWWDSFWPLSQKKSIFSDDIPSSKKDWYYKRGENKPNKLLALSSSLQYTTYACVDMSFGAMQKCAYHIT